MFFSSVAPKPSPKFSFSALIWILIFSAWNAPAQTQVVSSTNISSFNHKTIISIFGGTTVRSFSYEEAYGAHGYWSRWNVLQNSDYTYSFRIGSNYYLSATADGGFTIARSLGPQEKFGLEADGATYTIKTWNGAYVGCAGTSYNELQQVDRKTDSERWYFFRPQMPKYDTIVDANINSFTYHTIISIFGGDRARSFPYEEAYGAEGYWSKWDVIKNGDGTYSFKVGNHYYLHADQVNGVTIQYRNGTTGKFTLQGTRGSVHIRSQDGFYLECAGPGYQDINLVAERSLTTQWDFFEIGRTSTNTPLPIADAGPDQAAYTHDIITLDATNSYDPNGAGPISVLWTMDQAPLGSNASLSNDRSMTPTVTTDYPGTYIFRLNVVNSDGYTSYADRIIVTVEQNVKYNTHNGVNDSQTSILFPAEFHQVPVVFSCMQTFNGNDAADLRIFNVDVDGFDTFVEEEQSKDNEVSHGDETIGYLAMNPGIIYDKDGNEIGETGTVSNTQPDANTWFTVNSAQNWGNVVVFANMNTYNGTQQAHVRLRNVGGNAFQYKVEEWEYLDGAHASESVTFIILKTGSHTLPDNTVLQVKTHDADNDFKDVAFNNSFINTPVVLSQSQTTNGGTAIVTRQKDITTAGLKVRVQEEEKENGNHSTETIGIIAVGRL